MAKNSTFWSKFIFTGAKYSQYFYLSFLCEMWIFSCSLLWKSQFWLASLVLCAPRHGYYGTSGPPAPAKALTDLKLHLTNSSHPISSSSSTDMVVIHPGAVLAMVDLLPSVSSDSQPEVRKWEQCASCQSGWRGSMAGRKCLVSARQCESATYVCFRRKSVVLNDHMQVINFLISELPKAPSHIYLMLLIFTSLQGDLN